MAGVCERIYIFHTHLATCTFLTFGQCVAKSTRSTKKEKICHRISQSTSGFVLNYIYHVYMYIYFDKATCVSEDLRDR